MVPTPPSTRRGWRLSYRDSFSIAGMHTSRPLIRVLKLIVTDQGSAAAAGAGAPGPAWLFAMDQLFEAYVAERLQQVARGVEIAIQGPVRTFAVDGSFQLRPDVVVIAGAVPSWCSTRNGSSLTVA